MGYGKLARGVSEKEARRKLKKVMPLQEREADFKGASPPSVFVGSSNYPEVSAGVLSPQNSHESSLLDSPAEWKENGYGIERIASLRTSLVNSRRAYKAEKAGELLDEVREIAMASRPVDVEVSLDRKPSQSITGGRVKPVSASGDLSQLQLGENPSVNRKVEDMYYDTDANSETAVRELYSSGADTYSIRQSFSTGMLGEEDNRKLVPTRWSITAVDDIVSSDLRSNLRDYQELGEIKHFREGYVGNVFHVFLIPGRWEFELIELKRSGSVWNSMENTYIASNYENTRGRDQYADETAGAYYAARMADLEHLKEIRRSSKVLIVRDVTPEYWAPLGVWVIREAVRDAFENGETLQSMEEVKQRISDGFKFLYSRIKHHSRLLNERQSTLESF